jgi:hypothetical protein
LLRALFRLLDPQDTGVISIVLFGQCLCFNKFIRSQFVGSNMAANKGGDDDENESTTLVDAIRSKLQFTPTATFTTLNTTTASYLDTDVGKCVWAALGPTLWNTLLLNYIELLHEKDLLDERQGCMLETEEAIGSDKCSLTWGEVREYTPIMTV